MEKIAFDDEDLLYPIEISTLSAVGVLLLMGESIKTAVSMFYPPIR